MEPILSILFRYLAKEILWATLLLLFALLALFALFEIINEMGDLGKGDYRLPTALWYVFLSIPSKLVLMFPVAALMGTIFAVARLSSHSELTVMRASGLSLARLAGFTALIGFAFSAVTFLFGEYIAPVADELAKQTKLAATSKVVAKQFRSGFWMKDDLSFVNIQSITPETDLIDLRIYEFDRSYRLTALSIAKRATYDAAAARWTLTNVERTAFDGYKARIEKLPTAVWKSAMTPDVVGVLRLNPNVMSLGSLSTYIEHLRENKSNSTQYELAFWGKILQPVAVIIMMLLAIPFAIQSQRAGSIGAKLVLGILVGLGFYFLNQVASHLTLTNDWSPAISASIPLLAFLLAAIAMLWMKERTARLSFARA